MPERYAWSWDDYYEQFGGERASPSPPPHAPAAETPPAHVHPDLAKEALPGPDTAPCAVKDLGSAATEPTAGEGPATGEGQPVVAPSPDRAPVMPASLAGVQQLLTSSEAADIDAIFAIVLIPRELHARLVPHAERRIVSVDQLVTDLLEIELDGDLIDITLDGEDLPEAATGAERPAPEQPSIPQRGIEGANGGQE